VPELVALGCYDSAVHRSTTELGFPEAAGGSSNREGQRLASGFRLELATLTM
jgi:hypothetical protein